MSTKRIHVNRNVMASNAKHGTDRPVITVKEGRANRYARSVEILGPSRMVYSPDKPLSCGAKCWVETESDIVLIGEDIK